MKHSISYIPTALSPVATIIIKDDENDKDDRDDAVHICEPIKQENIKRVRGGENTVSIFRDYDKHDYLRVGIEFVQIKICPFCGGEL